MRPLEAAELQPFLEEIEARGNHGLAMSIREGRFGLVIDQAQHLHLVSGPLAKAAAAWPTEMPSDALGEPWGLLGRRRWTPSLAAMVRIGAATPQRRVVLHDRAAQFFLYHKPVRRDGVEHVDPSVRPGDEVWVCDRSGLVLGRGTWMGATAGTQGALRPIDDLGWYLREGG